MSYLVDLCDLLSDEAQFPHSNVCESADVCLNT